MVPATVGGVVTLVLLVLPGLVFELVRQRRRPGRQDSAFAEISRVLVAGLALAAVTLTLLAVVSLVGPRSLVSLAELISADRAWLAQHAVALGWTAWAYGLVSVTLAALTAAILPGTNPAGRIHPESGWVTAFNRLPTQMRRTLGLPATPAVQLSVRLTDGTVYVGDRAEFSVDLSLEDRELALAGALACRPPDATEAHPLPGWQRVLLRGDSISDIVVRYVPGTPTPEPARSPLAWMVPVRRTCARILDQPSEASWLELAEAPAAHLTSALRLLGLELIVLLVVAALTRLA
jgi:Family of unknown function (DUF6338)